MPDDPNAQRGEADVKIPPELQPHFHELREENKSRRLENKALEDKLTAAAAKVEALSAQFTEREEAFKKLAGVKPDDKKTDPIQALADQVTGLQTRLAAAEMKATEGDKAAREAAITGEFKAQVAQILAEGVDASVLLKLLDRSKLSVDGTTGEVTGVAEAIADLQKQVPQLFDKTRRITMTPGGGNPPSRPGAGQDETGLSAVIKRLADQKAGFGGVVPGATPHQVVQPTVR
jgi:hypothetical protein